MAKIKLYDEQGKEVFFDFAVDAREAVATGRYFETLSGSGVKPVEFGSEPKVVKPGPGRKPKPVSEEGVIDPEETEEDSEE